MKNDIIAKIHEAGGIVSAIASTPRTWFQVTGITLETLQGLFVTIQVSTLDDSTLAFPLDTVTL